MSMRWLASGSSRGLGRLARVGGGARPRRSERPLGSGHRGLRWLAAGSGRGLGRLARVGGGARPRRSRRLLGSGHRGLRWLAAGSGLGLGRLARVGGGARPRRSGRPLGSGHRGLRRVRRGGCRAAHGRSGEDQWEGVGRHQAARRGIHCRQGPARTGQAAAEFLLHRVVFYCSLS